MKFSHWYYTGKFGVFLFFFVGLRMFWGEQNAAIKLIGDIALIFIIVLGITGALLGISLAFGKLKMKCPFVISMEQLEDAKEKGCGWTAMSVVLFMESGSLDYD